MSKNLEIAKMLTLSTAHIKKETAEFLNNPNSDLIVFAKGEYGWFISGEWIQEELIPDIPEDLIKIVHLAQENECLWICLDRDGEEIEGLPVYKW